MAVVVMVLKKTKKRNEGKTEWALTGMFCVI